MKSFFENLILESSLLKNNLVLYFPWLVVIVVVSLLGVRNYDIAYFAVFLGWVPTMVLKILWVESSSYLVLRKIKFDPKIERDIALKVLRSTKIMLLASVVIGLLLYPLLPFAFESKPHWSKIPIIIIMVLVTIMVLAGMLNVVRARLYLGKALSVAENKKAFNKDKDIENSRPQPMTAWGFHKTYIRVKQLLGKPKSNQ